MLLRFKLVLLLAFLLVVHLTSLAEKPFSFATTPGQLPKNIIPKHYDVRLAPNLEQFTTHGSVTIDFEVLKPTRTIILNALGLKISHAELLLPDTARLSVSLDERKQVVRLKTPVKLTKGKYQLRLEFDGKIGEQAQGLFYVKYPSPSGQKTMLGTQMEPSDARRMFPCWDEPVYRATFHLTVTLPENFQGFSNLPVERETAPINHLKEITFGRTPPMASYLVVLVAGELETIEDEVDGTKIRVVTTAGKKEQGRYALDATKKLLAYYNNYFGIKYPLPKLDQIAIPGGFDGAMENWGGITYNESVLLYDPKTSSPQTQREIFITLAHEMSHQWFGNLVTTAWWDDLWLNEGFATWMETKATEHFNPTWEMQLSANAEKASVMTGDARPSTHPIQDKVRDESEANDAFDSITYQKGGALIRMLENYMGPEIFRAGVQQYLTAHSYSSATTADLWQTLEKTSQLPINNICAGWTEQPGLPLVSISTICTNGKQRATFKQERFTIQDPSPKPLRWKIPISFFKETDGEIGRLLLTNKSAMISAGRCDEWLKANVNDNGYYVANYSAPLLQKLKDHLSELSPADRLNLLNDCWALVEAKHLSITNYLALIEALPNEHSYVIWNNVISVLTQFEDLEQQAAGHNQFQKYSCHLLLPPFERLGWSQKNGEPVTDSLLRNRVIESLGRLGDETIINEAKRRFASFVKDPDSLEASLRPAIFKIVGRYADQVIYNQLHQLATNAPGTEERQRYYSAMTQAQDPQLIAQTLAISLTDESVPQETTGLVIQVADNSGHPELAWEFADQHLRELLPRVDSFARNEYVPSLFSAFSDAAHAKELESIIRAKVSLDAVPKAQIAAEEIRFKAGLKERSLPVIEEWIKNKKL